jgi:hypothetical protein
MEQKQINDRIDDIVDNAGDGLCCSHAACHKMRDTSPFSILRPRNFSFRKEGDPSPRCNAHSERERRPQCPGEQTFRAHLLCFLFFELTQDINDDLHRACVRRLVRIPSLSSNAC